MIKQPYDRTSKESIEEYAMNLKEKTYIFLISMNHLNSLI